MKVIYDTLSGAVIRVAFEENPTLTDGQAAISVPDSVIAQTVVRVHPDGQLDTDLTIIDTMWKSVREYRAKLLRDSDWICSVTDYVAPDKDKWIAYRQALRDLTSLPNPFALTWPKAPNE